jgi:hypothetical protein
MKNILSFIAGIGIGVAISWSFHKNKYENMIQEEVESLRNAKKAEHGDCTEARQEEPVEEIDNSAEEVYEETLNEARHIINYSGYSKKGEEEMGSCEKAALKNPIYVITPGEFATQVGYDTDTFYIFEDDIIADDNNDIVDNIEQTFGMKVKDIRIQFGVYEDDSVYIRNENTQTDYEILRELDTYEKRNGE